jgi:hypothetical protein
MPRKPANVPANEKMDAKFVRVAQGRVNQILQSLKQLGTLGNQKVYTSTIEQRKQIAEALKLGLERSMETLNKGGEPQQDFKLK